MRQSFKPFAVYDYIITRLSTKKLQLKRKTKILMIIQMMFQVMIHIILFGIDQVDLISMLDSSRHHSPDFDSRTIQ